jgi:hypothetical protein
MSPRRVGGSPKSTLFTRSPAAAANVTGRLWKPGDALLDLWEAQDSDDRWAEIEYVVRDGRFEATYTYPDAIDPEEDPMERRDQSVRRHFGEKPIIYSPWPPDEELDYEL